MMVIGMVVVVVRAVAVVMAMVLGVAMVVAAAQPDHREGRIGDQRVPCRGVRMWMGVRVRVVVTMRVVVTVVMRMQRRPGQAMLQAEGLIAAR